MVGVNVNLDDVALFQRIDKDQVISSILSMPDQLEAGWQDGLKNVLPEILPVTQVILAGMGASASASDLLAGYNQGMARIPWVVLRDYDLPAWAASSQALVVCLSNSGQSEETLTVFEQAVRGGLQVLALCGGGQLAQRARETASGLWTYPAGRVPQGSSAYPFGLLLALACRLGLLPDQSEAVAEAVQVMRDQQSYLAPASPAVRNPAKRMAGQMVGRWVVVFGAGMLGPVAMRWKARLNELAKTVAQVEWLPEADHNTLAGLNQPLHSLSQIMALFLRAPSVADRNRLRLEYTRHVYMMQGMNTDFIDASGVGALAHLWSLLQFGELTAYYLAMAYGENPAPADVLAALKDELKMQP